MSCSADKVLFRLVTTCQTLLCCRLKKEFEEILAENAAKPEAEQLPLEFFDIDPDLRPMVEKEIHEEEKRVHEEMADELEKQRLLLAKVRGVASRGMKRHVLNIARMLADAGNC